jgi:membrane protein required for colicin V production
LRNAVEARAMTGFDFAVIGILVLSTLLAFVRGVVRELLAIVSWIAGLFAALAFGDTVAAMIPGMESSPIAKHLVAYALVFIAVLIVGAIVAYLLSKLVHAAGLGFVDRFLGAVFGVARGVLIVMILVLVAGLTSLPRNEWWQNALLAPPLVAAALSLRHWLPPTWTDRLDYSAAGRKLGMPGVQSGVQDGQRRT